jgi:hypothetical protein
MPMSAALACALLSFIVGAGTVLSVIGTHLYAVNPENYRECGNAKSGRVKPGGAKGNSEGLFAADTINGSLTRGNVNERESFGRSVYMRSTAPALIAQAAAGVNFSQFFWHRGRRSVDSAVATS